MEIMSGNVGGGGSSYGSAHYASSLSLFFNIVFVVVLLVGLNYIGQRLLSRTFLRKGVHNANQRLVRFGAENRAFGRGSG
jgi:hypothetical protein